MNFKNEEGSAITFVVVIILCITLLAGSTMALAKTQMAWSTFGRQTSNSYHLAKSGAEKVVDSMNKEIAKEMPNLMEKAAKETHLKMTYKSDFIDGFKYMEDESKSEYEGSYIASENDDEYKANLKTAIYDHIEETFTKNNSVKYIATKTDLKKCIPIEIKTKVYKRSQLTSKIEKTVGNALGKDDFVVESIASAEEGRLDFITRSTLIGVITLDDLVQDEELLEEYEWAIDDDCIGIYPEVLQSAIISFGDLVMQGDNSANITGDIHVKGTTRETSDAEYTSGEFPDIDESGGIIISDGSDLEVNGNAFVVNNIQTTNTLKNETKETKIQVTKDAIANTIAINDNYYKAGEKVQNNRIYIGRNVYIDNDLQIARDVDGGKIKVEKSVFGISDGDSRGRDIGRTTYINPNKSSGIFSIGENSVIEMGRAFIGGQAFINFGDENGYHKLYESAGEPFEDVYYLDEYREKHGSSREYLDDFKDLIKTDKIIINDEKNSKPYGYAPAYVSANKDIHDISDLIITGGEARDLFYAGLNTQFSKLGKLTSDSDWNDKVPGTNQTWKKVIQNPEEYYKGTNPYNKDFEYENSNLVTGYKGLQGYMLAKRGVFYNGFKKGVADPEMSLFEDLVNLNVFENINPWSYNNPIEIIDSDKLINIDDYDKTPTAIISLNPDTIITLESSKAGEFEGVIITPGKIDIKTPMTIEGVIISGNEKTDAAIASREDIQKGKYAGVQIKAKDVNIIHNMNKILDIRFMDKSLHRKLFDCLNITSYKSIQEEVKLGSKQLSIAEKILGEKDKRRVNLRKDSVISAEKGGLQMVMKSLTKLK